METTSTIRYGPTEEALKRYTFILRPHTTSKPLLAIRLRRRSYADGNRPLFIIEKRDALRWANLGLPFAFWLATNPHTFVAFKLNLGSTSKTLNLARFICDCADGEGVRYGNGYADLRRSSLSTQQHNFAGPSVTSLIAKAQAMGYHQPTYRDWTVDLVEPGRVDLDRMVEKT